MTSIHTLKIDLTPHIVRHFHLRLFSLHKMNWMGYLVSTTVSHHVNCNPLSIELRATTSTSTYTTEISKKHL